MLRSVDVEFITDGLKQFQGTEFRVQDVGDKDIVRELLKKAAAQGRLAGTDFSGQHHEAVIFSYPILISALRPRDDAHS